MDQVILTRAQLKVMSEKGKDLIVTGTNEDAGLLYVEDTKTVGQGKGVWLAKNGRTREGEKY